MQNHRIQGLVRPTQASGQKMRRWLLAAIGGTWFAMLSMPGCGLDINVNAMEAADPSWRTRMLALCAGFKCAMESPPKDVWVVMVDPSAEPAAMDHALTVMRARDPDRGMGLVWFGAKEQDDPSSLFHELHGGPASGIVENLDLVGVYQALTDRAAIGDAAVLSALEDSQRRVLLAFLQASFEAPADKDYEQWIGQIVFRRR